MNFIEGTEGQEILVDLKYCERCGALWLRPQGGTGVYCGGCRTCLAAMPNPGLAPPRKPRRRKQRALETNVQTTSLQSSARVGCLQAVAAQVVWA